MQLGEEPGSEPGTVLNLAVMGLHLAGATNGVSRLHGEVSRAMFSGVWPDLAEDDIPIGHVTNGVHARSWVSREMVDLLDRTVGSDWAEAGADRWERMLDVTDEELWAIRRTNRERLVQYARRYVRVGLARRGLSTTETEWCEDILDPAAFTIGFARRFAPYKRADLVLADLDRLFSLVNTPDRPVQIVFAGKAHPADQPGKELLRQVADLAMQVDWRNRLVFLEDYDIGVGRMLIRGADLWLNTPRRPLEACGTSGMKAALNGALNCSILDGWWDECFDGDFGWAIPSAEWVTNDEERDAIEGRALIAILEREIVPAFFDRRDGVPREWLRRVRASLAGLGPVLTASRMLRDYVDDYYAPAAHRRRALEADEFRLARDLVTWRARVTKEWPSVLVTKVTHEEHLLVGEEQRITAEVALGGLSPDEIEVQLWHGPVDTDDVLHDPACLAMQPEGPLPGGTGALFVAQLPISERGMYGFAVRAIPSHPALRDEVRLNLPPSVPSIVACTN
jgi:starch phosphorylase